MKRAQLVAFTLLATCVMSSPAEAGFFNNTAYLSAEKAHEKGDYVKARQKWEKLLEVADKDIRTIAAFRLHDYYEEGLGVAKDAPSALRYLKLAASAGGEMSAMAHWRIGFYLETGNDGDYPIDRAAAAEHYSIAAAAGDKNAVESLSRLRDLPEVYIKLNQELFAAPREDLAPGGLKLGFKKLQAGDSAGAGQIFEWHARRGDAQAQYALAVLLAKSGRADDEIRSQAWGYLSAKGGWPESQRNHGIMLFRGVVGSTEEAKTWLRRAAEQGDHEAENLLGVVAANPKANIDPDYTAARTHFERAVAMGNTRALANLGDLHAEGLGVPVDKDRAIALYIKAADAGELEARNRLFTKFNIVHEAGSKPPQLANALPSIGQTMRELSPVDLFAAVSPSVLRIVALTADPAKSSQGSAVVLSPTELVTNCHVLAKARAVGANVGSKILRLTEGKARTEADLCILRSDERLTPVTKVRSYNSLRVGERVYAVGSPSGLENTFSEGIISGLRTENGLKYIQTNTAISPGSSGGGLFDSAGRLIGITTFAVRNAQSLNFAVSIEEMR